MYLIASMAELSSVSYNSCVYVRMSWPWVQHWTNICSKMQAKVDDLSKLSKLSSKSQKIGSISGMSLMSWISYTVSLMSWIS